MIGPEITLWHQLSPYHQTKRDDGTVPTMYKAPFKNGILAPFTCCLNSTSNNWLGTVNSCRPQTDNQTLTGVLRALSSFIFLGWKDLCLWPDSSYAWPFQCTDSWHMSRQWRLGLLEVPYEMYNKSKAAHWIYTQFTPLSQTRVAQGVSEAEWPLSLEFYLVRS